MGGRDTSDSLSLRELTYINEISEQARGHESKMRRPEQSVAHHLQSQVSKAPIS